MSRNYEPLIPRDILELLDHVGMMVVRAPRFATSAFPDLTVDGVFHELNEGLKNVRGAMGDDTYMKVVALSERARELISADPREDTGDTQAGRELLMEIRELLSKFVEGDQIQQED